MNPICEQIETEIEARQAQPVETLRGVHEQVIKLIDNMVQNYLGNMRRSIQRINNFIGRGRNTNSNQQQPRSDAVEQPALGQSIIDQLQELGKQFRDFTMQWARTLGKQQSPLIDRIPPRGVELWRDFWDTVRKQVRRINQEFVHISRDMGRLITGRLPINTNSQPTNSREQPITMDLLYSGAPFEASQGEVLAKKFHEFYDKLGATLVKEQVKMDTMLARQQAVTTDAQQQSLDRATNLSGNQQDSLFDELDDEATRDELNRNVALRQQIQQEINVFGSIFDIMRAFIQRLRDSASVFRDVIQPGALNTNDAVTPGPSVKPTVDQLLEDTINGQRNINGQAKPVLLPNKRPRQQ